MDRDGYEDKMEKFEIIKKYRTKECQNYIDAEEQSVNSEIELEMYNRLFRPASKSPLTLLDKKEFSYEDIKN